MATRAMRRAGVLHLHLSLLLPLLVGAGQEVQEVAEELLEVGELPEARALQGSGLQCPG